jgi:hypothetical protein
VSLYELRRMGQDWCRSLCSRVCSPVAKYACVLAVSLQVILGSHVDDCLNSFVNLAVNVYSMANPQAPKRNVSKVPATIHCVFEQWHVPAGLCL